MAHAGIGVTPRHERHGSVSRRMSVVLALAGTILLTILVSPAGANHSYPATYNGSIQGGGTVEFDVSADGAAVTRFAVVGFDAFPCATSVDSTTTGTIPISSGTPHSFSTSEFTGTFDANQHATGTFKAVFFGPSCTTPTRNWTATTTTPPPGPPPDNAAPETTITKGAPSKTEKSSVKFKFRSDEEGSTFECKKDEKPWKPCSSPTKMKRLDEGKHKFKVRATDAAGNTDPTPAKDKFKVVD
jgi:hypothetical protein